jgi:hypothetical protein
MINANDPRKSNASPPNEEAFANIVVKLFDFWSAAFVNMPVSPTDVFRASLVSAPGLGKGGHEDPDNGSAIAANSARALTAFDLLTRIQLAAALSAFRAGSNLAQAFGDHQPTFVRLMSEQASGSKLQEEERREILDDLRSWLREIGELSSQEARIFQSELQKIGDDLVNMADVGTTDDNYRRRWKCKI